MSSNWTNYSVPTRDDDNPGAQAVSDETPACVSCKKRKLRCSRETPACSHCVRLANACVYTPKQKPGLKTGALEALTRRVAFLERILLDDAGKLRSQFDHPGPGEGSVVEREAIRVEDVDPPPPTETAATPAEVPSRTQEAGLEVVDERSSVAVAEDRSNPRKRKLDEPNLATTLFMLQTIDISKYLPPPRLLLKLVDYFCVSFHHWIPYLHKKRLRESVSNGTLGYRSDLMLHALVSATLRHMDPAAIFMDKDQVAQQTCISRFLVETAAMRTASLESLRAIIILVFGYLNDGEPNRAWPLVGSLTRTVDYLQLTLEPTVCPNGALMSPLLIVPPTTDWTELEERRRLFWVIFLLDRFCSVSTGWNTSLTSEDVHRRLPADGGYFTRSEPVTTPFFGIWNKAAARIGKSLAHVPAQYNDDDPAVEQVQGSSPGSANGIIDSSKLGAFAYCIEATESLSQVTTFFLQQRINWQDKTHAISWLTRFKELDLRLVQWKMFLPPRWKDSNISQDAEVVDMDPNLTLAHITHNTSMILLHHSIAYPPREWSDYVALPKECSAQTCQHAAVETSNIVSKFLVHTPIPFVSVQFAFCAFVAAKALLFENQTTRRIIRPEFERLLRDLWDMSARWSGREGIGPSETRSPELRPLNQAGKYARHLEDLWEGCLRDPNFTFDFYDHSCRTVGLASSDARVAKIRPSTNFGAGVPSPTVSQKSETNLASSHSNQHPIIPRSTPSVIQQGHTPPVPVSSASPTHASRSQATSQFNPGHTPSPSSASPSYQRHHSTSTYGATYQSPYPPPQPMHHGTPPLHRHTLQDQSLLDLSDTLMGSQFLDMDRVITFEDANFFLPGDAFRWP